MEIETLADMDAGRWYEECATGRLFIGVAQACDQCEDELAWSLTQGRASAMVLVTKSRNGGTPAAFQLGSDQPEAPVR